MGGRIMGKIISGGLRSAAFDTANKTSTNQKPPKEGPSDYIIRNIAKTPVLAYELARSGLGVGNIVEPLLREGGAPKWAQKAARYILPTTQQANEEAQHVAPKFLTEHRPEDYWAELGLTELPFLGKAVAKGAVKGAVGLAKYGAKALTRTAGSKIGSSVGKAVGKKVGFPETGAGLGALGGGVLTGLALNKTLPSQALPQKVEQKQKNQFETNKSERLAEATQAAERELHLKKGELTKSIKELPKEKAQFQKLKDTAVKKVREDIKHYDDAIKKSGEGRAADYDQSAKITGAAQGKSDNINTTINEVYSDLPKGIDAADKSAIQYNLDALKAKTANGTLSVADAKEFQKNFNDQIYNYKASTPFKRQMNRVTKSLSDFIEQNSPEEANAAWKRGEQATREMKLLQRERKEFLKLKNQQIKDINNEKFSPEKEVHHKETQRANKESLNQAEKYHSDTIKSIGKEKYEDFIKSTTDQSKAAKILEKIGNVASDWGLAGVAGAIGKAVFGYKAGAVIGAGIKGYKITKNQYDIASQVMKEHPEIFKEYQQLIVDSAKLSTPEALRRVNDLGKKIEKYGAKEPKKGKIVQGGLKIK